ncbi:MAG: hypothetical protein KZQ58_04660 [gamma proteobacterium symbiont of Bathyaustriella thionipta]|nr:hypothetical protein [gamma proteobacterium symbiont of Bathyaustriella thionipta]
MTLSELSIWAQKLLQQQSASGKTLFAGFANDPPLLIQAGIDDPQQLPGWQTLLRYLVVRDSLHSYITLMPVWSDQHPVTLLEIGSQQSVYQAICHASDDKPQWQRVEKQQFIFGDLFDPEQPLPGIMRRNLDELAGNLSLTLDDEPVS